MLVGVAMNCCHPLTAGRFPATGMIGQPRLAYDSAASRIRLLTGSRSISDGTVADAARRRSADAGRRSAIAPGRYRASAHRHLLLETVAIPGIGFFVLRE